MVPGTWRMRSATTGMIGDWTDCIRVSRTAIASKSGRVAREKTGGKGPAKPEIRNPKLEILTWRSQNQKWTTQTLRRERHFLQHVPSVCASRMFLQRGRRQ